MTYILEVTPPKDQMNKKYKVSVYTLTATYPFKFEAKDVAKVYFNLGCDVRILKETRTVEVEE